MKYCFIIAIIAIVCSCNNNKLAGKIENRNGNYYLVNTSKTKVYQFTVKGTSSIGDSIIEYKTFTEILAPGEEKPIGQKSVVEKNPIFDYDGAIKAGYSDTEIADYIKLKFPDSISIKENGLPVQVDSLSNVFEVKGQIEVTNVSKYLTDKEK